VPRKDYYNILGIGRDATGDEIKRAFRQLALKYHPDRNPDDLDAATKFQDATEAYQVLSDPEERLKFDRLGPLYRPDGRPPTPEELQEMLSELVGGLFRRKRTQQHGDDLRTTLTVELEDVATGVIRKLQIARNVRCSVCGSTGADPNGGRKVCDGCNGTGKASARRVFRQSCARCDGRGFVVVKRCGGCDGKGLRGSEDHLKVKVPMGVSTGQKLKLRGRGHEGLTNGASGDLFVVVSVAEHPLFRRRGADLVCDLPLTFAEATLGGEITVPVLGARTTIKVPSGTPSGRILRLVGRGLPKPDGGEGDLHLKVEVEVPPRLDRAQSEALRRFQDLAGPGAHPQRRAFDEALKERCP
jgi:molecular chaperone DnaJ